MKLKCYCTYIRAIKACLAEYNITLSRRKITTALKNTYYVDNSFTILQDFDLPWTFPSLRRLLQFSFGSWHSVSLPCYLFRTPPHGGGYVGD